MAADGGTVPHDARPRRRSWLRSVEQAAWSNLSATTYLLVPLLFRALPSGCGASVLPLHRSDRGSRPRDRTTVGNLLGAVGVAVPGPGARVAAAAHQPRRLPGWVGRSMLRLRGPAAPNTPRSSHALVSRAWIRPPARSPVTGRDAAGSRGRTARVASPLVVHEDRRVSPPPPVHGTADQLLFPIDVVYTWVDDRDPAWRNRYTEALQANRGNGCEREATSLARFHNRDELRFSLRSLATYAPFVRNIYILTAGQTPSWLNPDAPNIRVVPHEEILDPDFLPTFNSHAIESALHRIDGLAEHYLYLNDDFFLGRRCHPTTFFTGDGRPKLFPDPRATVPEGPCSPADRAVDSASKNTREIMYAEFDFVVRHKMKHVPYPQRRSVLVDMEQRFPWVFRQTARNPFRHHTDVNIPSCLSHYYGFVTGAAVVGRVPASYINIGNPWAQLQMNRLLQRADRDVFCLNDCPMSGKRRAAVDATVTSFLEEYFPVAAPWERGR